MLSLIQNGSVVIPSGLCDVGNLVNFPEMVSYLLIVLGPCSVTHTVLLPETKTSVGEYNWVWSDAGISSVFFMLTTRPSLFLIASNFAIFPFDNSAIQTEPPLRNRPLGSVSFPR